MEITKINYYLHQNFQLNDYEDGIGYYIVITSSYLKLKFGQNKLTSVSKKNLRVKLDKGLIYYFIEKLPIWTKQNKFTKNFIAFSKNLPNKKEELKDIIFNEEFEFYFGRKYLFDRTPNSLKILALHILNIGKNEKFADLCTGTGSVLFNKYNCNSSYGCDNNKELSAIASMRASLKNNNIKIECKNVFSVEQSFDKIFCSYPLAMRRFGNIKDQTIAKLFDSNVVIRPSTCDWIFNMKVMTLLNKKGRAVCVTSVGELFNRLSKSIREWFIEHGYIEAVIALPERILSSASISPILIVFSYGNTKIRMVNGVRYFQKGRRYNFLNDNDIECVLGALKNDIKNVSCTVDLDEVRDIDYTLDPAHYTQEKITINNGIALGELASSISRGSSLSKMHLEKLHSNSKTNYRYLMLKDINNGQISENLPYIKNIPDNNSRYCLNDGDIVLSKIGPNFKVALINKPKNESILATGNLYILRFDDCKLPLEYIKLFLESKQGQLQFRRLSTGTFMKGISLESLKKVQIPNSKIDEIDSVINKYKSLITEISLHTKAIKKAEEQIKDLF